MKTHFLFPYWCRFLGIALFLVHVPVVLCRKALGFVQHDDVGQGLFNSHHVFFLCTALLMLIGLFLIAFAKERIEDEQIWQIRLDSLRWAIYVNYLVLIVSLVFVEDTGHLMELNLWVPLLFFIIRFRWVIFRLNQSLNKEV
ncbi:MAG: hypothetical protein ABI166_12650 [Mucilaginibacter sp.]